MTLFPAVIEELHKRGVGDVVVFGGGIIPPEDIAVLRQAGVRAIFTPGATTQEIVDWVRSSVRPRHA